MSTEMTPAMRRSVLIAALRDKSMWPEGFEWNYTRRCSCAVGLGEELYGCVGETELGLSATQVINVFNGWAGDQWRVTPEMVADRLEGIHNDIQARAGTAS